LPHSVDGTLAQHSTFSVLSKMCCHQRATPFTNGGRVTRYKYHKLHNAAVLHLHIICFPYSISHFKNGKGHNASNYRLPHLSRFLFMNAPENTGERSQPNCRSEKSHVLQTPHCLHTEPQCVSLLLAYFLPFTIHAHGVSTKL